MWTYKKQKHEIKISNNKTTIDPEYKSITIYENEIIAHNGILPPLKCGSDRYVFHLVAAMSLNELDKIDWATLVDNPNKLEIMIQREDEEGRYEYRTEGGTLTIILDGHRHIIIDEDHIVLITKKSDGLPYFNIKDVGDISGTYLKTLPLHLLNRIDWACMYNGIDLDDLYDSTVEDV